MSCSDPDVRSRVIGRNGGGSRGEEYLRLLGRSMGIRLERARRFSASLWQAPRSLEVPQIVIGGNCRQTQARLLAERPQDRGALRVRPADILHPRPGLDHDALMFEMGDGMVTASSLLARPAWPSSRAAGQPLEPDIRYRCDLSAIRFPSALRPEGESRPVFLDTVSGGRMHRPSFSRSNSYTVPADRCWMRYWAAVGGKSSVMAILEPGFDAALHYNDGGQGPLDYGWIQLFMGGKLKLTGNMMLAQKMQDLFSLGFSPYPWA